MTGITLPSLSLTTLLLTSAALASAQSATERERGLRLYETKILPVLETECFRCHSIDERVRGGLRLDSAEGALEGGSTGPAIVPGKPGESLLIRAIRYADPDYEMPPKKQLPESVVKDFEEWIRLGAPFPAAVGSMSGGMMSDAMSEGMSGAMNGAVREGEVVTIDSDSGVTSDGAVDWGIARDHWSFKPILQHPAPTPDGASWCWGSIDRFVLDRIEREGLTPVADADRDAWLRRVTFDLTGLPPTIEEQDAFAKDRSSQAFEKVVDRLLASQAFGERWGRHWLDAARYGESSGKETNIAYPYAWRYRDYVIDSFNGDKPYNEFLQEQLAGDVMPTSSPQEKAEHLIATGFLAIGPKGHNTRGRQQFVADTVDEQIDAMGQAMLGLTIACARCHDHKFDPIPQEDYYKVAGIFLSTKTLYGTTASPGNNFPAELAELPTGSAPLGATLSPQALAFGRRAIEQVEERIKAEQEQAQKNGTEVDRGRIRNLRQAASAGESVLERYNDDGTPNDLNLVCMGVEEGPGRNAPVLARGEIDKPGPTVVRGFPQIFQGDWVPTIRRGSGRLELAEWVTSPENPLTARVAANRIWLHLFGKGIVPTPDNLGMSGQPPTHPELLDYLAARFMQGGWSTKGLVREIVLSHTYRLSSKTNAEGMKTDPAATLYWRMPERRLEAEAIRDAMLACGGELQLERPIGSPIQSMEGPARAGERLEQRMTTLGPVRSVYLPILRNEVPEELACFDFGDPSLPCGDRAETTVASQALYLMNDDRAIDVAREFARRLAVMDIKDQERIEVAFRLALGREPNSTERSACRRFFDDFAKADAVNNDSRSSLRERAWTAFCQSLFMTSEFRTLS